MEGHNRNKRASQSIVVTSLTGQAAPFVEMLQQYSRLHPQVKQSREMEKVYCNTYDLKVMF